MRVCDESELQLVYFIEVVLVQLIDQFEGLFGVKGVDVFVVFDGEVVFFEEFDYGFVCEEVQMCVVQNIVILVLLVLFIENFVEVVVV